MPEMLQIPTAPDAANSRHWFAKELLLQPYMFEFLDFEQLSHLSETNKYHAMNLSCEQHRNGYWNAMSSSLAAQFDMYSPEITGDARAFFFKEMWPARKKWDGNGLEQNFDISVACRFRPGQRVEQAVSLPLHQFLKVKRSQQSTKESGSMMVGEAPKEEYLDALLGNVMTDPVRLPSSGRIVERAIGEDCARRGRDPFTNKRLLASQLVPMPDLAEEIRQYRERVENYNVLVGVNEMKGLVDKSAVDPAVLEALVAAEKASFASRRAAHDAEEDDRSSIHPEPALHGDEIIGHPGLEEADAGGLAVPVARELTLHAQPLTNLTAVESDEDAIAQDKRSQAAAADDTGAPRWRGRFKSSDNPQIVSVDPKKSCVAMHVPGLGVRPFHLNQVYPASSTQAEVYKGSVRNLVVSALNGTTSCVMCYGQTSSGKTFTMFGPDDDDLSARSTAAPEEVLERRSAGAVLVACKELLRALRVFGRRGNISLLVTAQFAEIYNEAVTDLLTGNSLAVRRSDGSLVGGREVLIQDEASIVAMLREGQARKHFASTAMNDRSSRAHTILIFSLTQNNAKLGTAMKSHLFLVDLAGSERVKHSRVEGNQLVEATAINSSLLVLGKVISKLSRSEVHIPYFESRLTTVLKGAFGGNSRTCVIVTCRSDDKKYGTETLQTLRFGERCGMISNQTKVAATSLEAVLDALNASMHAVEKQIHGLSARGKTNIPSFKKLEIKLADLRRHKENIETKVQIKTADDTPSAPES